MDYHGLVLERLNVHNGFEIFLEEVWNSAFGMASRTLGRGHVPMNLST